jgi:hypothetical protein
MLGRPLGEKTRADWMAFELFAQGVAAWDDSVKRLVMAARFSHTVLSLWLSLVRNTYTVGIDVALAGNLPITGQKKIEQ